eukprot:RCo043699
MSILWGTSGVVTMLLLSCIAVQSLIATGMPETSSGEDRNKEVNWTFRQVPNTPSCLRTEALLEKYLSDRISFSHYWLKGSCMSRSTFDPNTKAWISIKELSSPLPAPWRTRVPEEQQT